MKNLNKAFLPNWLLIVLGSDIKIVILMQLLRCHIYTNYIMS